MERVSSVTAFLCRYLGDADAQKILNSLTPAERRAVELLVTVPDPGERLRRLREETGSLWNAARYEYVVDRAMNELRQRLEQQGLLQP